MTAAHKCSNFLILVLGFGQSLVDVNPRSTAAAVNAQLRAMMPDLLEAGEWLCPSPSLPRVDTTGNATSTGGLQCSTAVGMSGLSNVDRGVEAVVIGLNREHCA